MPSQHVVHIALGTALAAMVFTSASSMRAHHAHGAVDWNIARAMSPGMLAGSFVAARDASGKIHYAGGLGWRFGDAGSGYELGRRAIARALLELQGWAPASGLARWEDHLVAGFGADPATIGGPER